MFTEQVQSFISSRFMIDCNWTNGNCYYFAQILKCRFPFLDIYYLPVQGHFAVSDGSNFYDYTGLAQLVENERPIKWDDLAQTDALLHAHIIRDCVL